MAHSVLQFFLTDYGLLAELCLVITGTSYALNKLSS